MSAQELLMIIDPVARTTDGESVRIARDVLCAGAAGVKVCLPEGPGEAARALARRGSRRPVVVGDDRALLRTVRLLHQKRDLAGCALSMVPVGSGDETVLARVLGVPVTAVEAARAVLNGTDRPRDLLVDDSGGVVLGTSRVPAATRAWAAGVRADGWDPPDCYGERAQPGRSIEATDVAGPAHDMAGGAGVGGGERPSDTEASVVDGADLGLVPRQRRRPSLVDTLTRPRPRPLLRALRRGSAGVWLRVEADGVVLADLDQPLAGVSISTEGDGLAAVTVRRRAAADVVRARARTVTISGPDFRYRADAVVGGPVRVRTWTTYPSAWQLTLPGAAEPAAGEMP